MEKPKILYDSHCKICNAEIEYYKKKDQRKAFDYIDITNPCFSPESFGLTKSDVHKYFHVINMEGHVLKGVEAFYYIWRKLDLFQLLQKLYRLRVGMLVMKLGYKGFVKVRPYLPRKENCKEYCDF